MPRRRLPRPRRVPRPRPRLLAAILALLLLAGGGWLWLRSSSLVAVRQVTISGVSGPDAGRIRAALRSAARGMTTLDVKQGLLHTAVAPYPVVKRLAVSTSFPHTMRIRVIEQVPVGEISADGRQIAVSSDGTLLHDAPDTGPLPTIPVSVFPAGHHVDGAALSEVHLLAAAPYPLLAKVAQVFDDSAHGFVAALRQGPRLYFGHDDRLRAKWSAAAAVLAAPSSAGATYIDVSDPSRPAAGAASESAAGTGSTGGG